MYKKQVLILFILPILQCKSRLLVLFFINETVTLRARLLKKKVQAGCSKTENKSGTGELLYVLPAGESTSQMRNVCVTSKKVCEPLIQM